MCIQVSSCDVRVCLEVAKIRPFLFVHALLYSAKSLFIISCCSSVDVVFRNFNGLVGIFVLIDLLLFDNVGIGDILYQDSDYITCLRILNVVMLLACLI